MAWPRPGYFPRLHAPTPRAPRPAARRRGRARPRSAWPSTTSGRPSRLLLCSKRDIPQLLLDRHSVDQVQQLVEARPTSSTFRAEHQCVLNNPTARHGDSAANYSQRIRAQLQAPTPSAHWCHSRSIAEAVRKRASRSTRLLRGGLLARPCFWRRFPFRIHHWLTLLDRRHQRVAIPSQN
jgi:hypothetical protein